MTKATCAAVPRLRNALFCSLLALGLAACGADESSSGSGSVTLVRPNLGVITRHTGTGSQNSFSPGTSTIDTPAPDGSQSGTPPVVSVNPGSSPPPVASIGTATLDWTPPTLNSDGTALTDLAGYTVYYGTAPDKLSQSVKVTNPGLSAFTVSNLASGTWYFAISAYSTSGTESVRTDVISTTI